MEHVHLKFSGELGAQWLQLEIDVGFFMFDSAEALFSAEKMIDRYAAFSSNW